MEEGYRADFTIPKPDGEGIIVEYRKHIPSCRGDSRIARRMFVDAVRAGGETPPLRVCGGKCRVAAPIAPYPSLPPRGRGTAIAVEGACAISIFAIVVFLRILPQSPSAPAPSRREPNAPPNVRRCSINVETQAPSQNCHPERRGRKPPQSKDLRTTEISCRRIGINGSVCDPMRRSFGYGQSPPLRMTR